MYTFFDFLLRVLGKYSDIKFFTVSWFIRLVWAPCLLWALYDLVLYLTGKDTSGDNLANVYIRGIAGFALFLIWFFLVRKKKGN